MNGDPAPRSLVTGGAGFIGSHVAHACSNLGHKVVVLDDLSGGYEDQVPPEATFVRGSVTDGELAASLFREHKFNYVYHLAAYAAEGLSHFIRRFNYTVNLLGSINLINEAIKAETSCFVFASSIAVYGQGQLPMREDMAPQPADPYGISKLAVELDLAAAQEQFGLNYTIFRPHNVYGPHQNLGDPYRNVLGIFMKQILQGEPMTIFGDGEQTRAFSYIDDVAPYIAGSVEIPEARNQIFNIGAARPYSVNSLAAMVAEAFQVPARTVHLPSRKEVVHAYASHKKAERILGAWAAVSLEDGIKRMADWVSHAGLRVSAPFKNVELAQGLPASWARLLASASK
jgi:UDP-glucose 4-epimerase